MVAIAQRNTDYTDYPTGKHNGGAHGLNPNRSLGLNEHRKKRKNEDVS